MNDNKLQYYCFDCGIPVFDFMGKSLDYSQAFVCQACAVIYSKDCVEIAKINGAALRPRGRAGRPHQPRWNYPNTKSAYQDMLPLGNYTWKSEFLYLPNEIKAVRELANKMKQDIQSQEDESFFKEVDKCIGSNLDIARTMFPIEPMPQSVKLTFDWEKI